MYECTKLQIPYVNIQTIYRIRPLWFWVFVVQLKMWFVLLQNQGKVALSSATQV